MVYWFGPWYVLFVVGFVVRSIMVSHHVQRLIDEEKQYRNLYPMFEWNAYARVHAVPRWQLLFQFWRPLRSYRAQYKTIEEFYGYMGTGTRPPLTRIQAVAGTRPKQIMLLTEEARRHHHEN